MSLNKSTFWPGITIIRPKRQRLILMLVTPDRLMTKISVSSTLGLLKVLVIESGLKESIPVKTFHILEQEAMVIHLFPKITRINPSKSKIIHTPIRKNMMLQSSVKSQIIITILRSLTRRMRLIHQQEFLRNHQLHRAIWRVL